MEVRVGVVCGLTVLFWAQIIAFTKEEMKKAGLSEQTMIGIIWTSVMSCVEWNKKEELVTEQAIKHLKVAAPSGLCSQLQEELRRPVCPSTAIQPPAEGLHLPGSV